DPMIRVLGDLRIAREFAPEGELTPLKEDSRPLTQRFHTISRPRDSIQSSDQITLPESYAKLREAVAALVAVPCGFRWPAVAEKDFYGTFSDDSRDQYRRNQGR